jgi:acetyl-CoA/propionyl-CoA carboxylase, biotin carboxylase, biotin carboxyl carrier protein
MSFKTIEHAGRQIRVAVVRGPKGVWVGYPGGARFFANESSVRGGAADAGNAVLAPMTAKVVQVRVSAGAEVAEGALLVVLEAMKMEYRLVAPRAGSIAEVGCHEGELVDLGAVLVRLA